MSASKNEQYLDKFRKLEEHIRQEYNLQASDSAINCLRNQPEFMSIRTELDYCRDVRNLLSHRPKIDDKFSVEVTDAMLTLLDDVSERVMHPKKVSDVFIPRERVLVASTDENVLVKMKEMANNNYTHIPVIEDGKVVGVFSENALLRILTNSEKAVIEDGLTFAGIRDYTGFGSSETETYLFVNSRCSVYKLSEMFDSYNDNGKHIGMVFVTENGQKDSRLLGILTAWEIIGE